MLRISQHALRVVGSAHEEMHGSSEGEIELLRPLDEPSPEVSGCFTHVVYDEPLGIEDDLLEDFGRGSRGRHLDIAVKRHLRVHPYPRALSSPSSKYGQKTAVSASSSCRRKALLVSSYMSSIIDPHNGFWKVGIQYEINRLHKYPSLAATYSDVRSMQSLLRGEQIALVDLFIKLPQLKGREIRVA